MHRLIKRANATIGDAIREEQESPDAEVSGPNRMALACEQSIRDLEAARSLASKSGRKSINRRLAEVRRMLAWCKTRAGYAKPQQKTFDTPVTDASGRLPWLETGSPPISDDMPKVNR